jgi:hypothetical protein
MIVRAAAAMCLNWCPDHHNHFQMSEAVLSRVNNASCILKFHIIENPFSEVINTRNDYPARVSAENLFQKDYGVISVDQTVPCCEPNIRVLSSFQCSQRIDLNHFKLLSLITVEFQKNVTMELVSHSLIILTTGGSRKRRN